MKLCLVLFGMVGFSVLCQQLITTGQKRIAASRQAQSAATPIRSFLKGSHAVAFSADGKPLRVAMAWQELENYDRVEAQRKAEKLAGRTPWPHGTYTMASGTKCEVLAQRGAMVEVMWLEGPQIQSTAWIYAKDLKEGKQ